MGLRVCDLINPETGKWIMDKLDFHFFPPDIEKIIKINPIRDSEDFYVWHHNKNGEFSVKSAYWLATSRSRSQALIDASSLPSINPLKEEVWKIDTEPKIKVFLWKVLSESISVAEVLNKRGMNVDNVCQVCGLEGESIEHILFDCSMARQIWALMNFPAPKFGFQNGSIFSNVHHFLKHRNDERWPKDVRLSFPWIIWRIWKNRNSFLFENKMFTGSETTVKITSDIEDWLVAQSVEEEEKTGDTIDANRVSDPQNEIESRWIRPPRLWLKCNVGASWSKNLHLAGSAWVLRDEHGIVLSHSRRAFSNVSNREEAEFLSLLWAMESMVSMNFNKLIFEMQILFWTSLINRPKPWPSYKYHFLKLKDLLSNFQQAVVSLGHSHSNRGASLIAKSVTSDLRLQSYVAASFPSWLKGLFDEEMMNSSIS